MLRAIGAAIAGYIAGVVVAFGLLTLAWIVLGPSGSFEPGTWDTSMKWNLTNAAVGLVTAIIGGYVCALISPGARSLRILIGLIIVLSAWAVVSTVMKPEVTEPRPENVAMFDAMGKATAPVWAVVLNSIIGVIGVIIGSRLRGQPPAPKSA